MAKHRQPEQPAESALAPIIPIHGGLDGNRPATDVRQHDLDDGLMSAMSFIDDAHLRPEIQSGFVPTEEEPITPVEHRNLTPDDMAWLAMRTAYGRQRAEERKANNQSLTGPDGDYEVSGGARIIHFPLHRRHSS